MKISSETDNFLCFLGSSPSTGLTPSSSVDKDMLMQSFLNSTINSNKTVSVNCEVPSNFRHQFSSHSKVQPMRRSRSGSSLCNLSTSPILQTPLRNSVYGREKPTPPSSLPYSSQAQNSYSISTYNSRCSSEESGFQDFDKSFDSGSGTMSNSSNSYVKSVGSNTSTSTLLAGTPLSPVHEAKEPRASPITSPMEEKLPLKQFINARRNLALDILTDHGGDADGANDENNLPDLETISAI